MRTRDTGGGASSSWVLAIVGILGVFFGMVAWAMVSPTGGAPDDDYHLGSIWCPDPVEGGSCDVVVSNGEVTNVIVPETVYMSQHCWAFHPEQSAACSDALSDQNLVPSYRFDTGSYPPGFYQFHHTFVGTDVHRSIMVMRVANVILGLGALTLAGALALPRRRQDLLLATVVAWVPMGVYFVASNNPTSWAISGTLIYAAGLLCSVESERWRRWALLLVAASGAGMAMMSRPDAAFFIFVVTLATWLLIPLRRQRIPELVVSVAASLLGLIVLMSSNQASSLTGDGGWPVDENLSALRVFLMNLLSLPEYAASFWGLGMGPGWMDVPLYGWSTLTMVVLFGGLVFAGADYVSWRKGLAALVLFGALFGIPVVSMTLRHVQPLTYYQGRYMLPLLAVALFVWLRSSDRKPLVLAPGQFAMIAAVASIANALALRSTTYRFSTGVNSGNHLSAGSLTWWPWVVGPKVVWMGGALAMAIGITLLLLLVTRQRASVRDTLGSVEPEQPNSRGWNGYEGNHSGRRVRHAATPAHAGHIEAADAGVRQTDDLLPADDTDAGGNQ